MPIASSGNVPEDLGLSLTNVAKDVPNNGVIDLVNAAMICAMCIDVTRASPSRKVIDSTLEG